MKKPGAHHCAPGFCCLVHRKTIFFGFFREFRETRQARNAAVRGCPSFAQPLETESERTTETGRQRKDPSGTTTTMTRPSAACSICRMRANKPLFHGNIPAGKKSALLSRLLRKSVHATKPAAVPVVAVAVPFRSTVQLPFPENGASCDGHFFANLRPMGAASRKSRKNLFFTRSRGGRGELRK